MKIDSLYCSGGHPVLGSPSQHRPDDPGILGRQGNSSHVVACSRFQGLGPAAFPVLLAGRQAQGRSRAVNQQGPQHHITSLTDGAKPGLAAAGVLLGCEPQPSGKLPPVLEGLRVAYAGDQSRCRNGANPLDGHQPLGGFALPGQGRDLAVVGEDALIQCPEPVMELADGFSRQQGQLTTANTDLRQQLSGLRRSGPRDDTRPAGRVPD